MRRVSVACPASREFLSGCERALRELIRHNPHLAIWRVKGGDFTRGPDDWLNMWNAGWEEHVADRILVGIPDARDPSRPSRQIRLGVGTYGEHLVAVRHITRGGEHRQFSGSIHNGLALRLAAFAYPLSNA